jgi:hypothetical protein
MELPPTCEIVARVRLPRACGCLQAFRHCMVDKYRARRQAIFQSNRYPACVAKLVEQAQKALPPRKGEVLKQLPPGTQVTLRRGADGAWSGSLSADGTAVDVVGVARKAAPGDCRRSPSHSPGCW